MVTGEFDEEILEDLIREGYNGEKLLNEFKRIRAEVPVALNKMFEEQIQKSGSERYTLEDVFEWMSYFYCLLLKDT